MVMASMSCGFGIGMPDPLPIGSVCRQKCTFLAVLLTIAALSITLTGCKKPGFLLEKSAADVQTADPNYLTTLRLLWRLPGMEATQSLLTSNQTGAITLAVKQTGDHVWDLCGIEVQRGSIKWCSRLSRRADIALSIVANKAMVHDPAGNVTAYDLETGQFQWAMKLDCEIEPKYLRAVGKGLALASCGQGGIVVDSAVRTNLVAIDLDHGQVRWRHALPTYDARIFIHEEKLIADLHRGLSHPRSPPYLPRRSAHGFRHFPPPPHWPDANALVGSQESGWTILDVNTGESLPPSVLSHAPDASDRRTARTLIAESLFSDGVFIFDQDKDGAKHNPFAQKYSWECPPLLHDPWWWGPRGPLLRAGRLFAVGCNELSEIDPATGEQINAWSMVGGDDSLAPKLIALEVAGERLTLAVGSRDDRKTGRIVTFEGTKIVSASKAPGLDPDLIAMTGNVLVVQEQDHLGPPDNVASDATHPKPVLAGYSVSDVRIAGDNIDRLNADKIKTLIAHLGTADRNYCSECEAILDAKSMAALKSIPRWEDILASLLLDRSEAAFAAAKQIHTPGLLRVLLRLVDTPPAPVRRPWNRESLWWDAIEEHRSWVSLQAAMVLIELRHIPAMKPLARLLLNAPEYDPHNPFSSSRFPKALCPWIGASDLPEAKEAIEDYDRMLNAPGAWKARCGDATRAELPRRRASAPK
jgi:hypothetical protein